MKDKWDRRFISLAEFISKWSLDPSTKVGCVIVDKKNRIKSLGYNGFPRGIKDDERLNNRDIKYSIICHSEVNGILFAQTDLTDCIIYTYPFMPCSKCSSMIIQAGITRVVAPYSDNERWIEDFKLSCEILNEVGIEISILDAPTLNQEYFTKNRDMSFRFIYK